MTEPLLYLVIFCAGIIVGVILVRYGIRVGNRLTVAAMNSEPLDDRTVSRVLDIQDKTG